AIDAFTGAGLKSTLNVTQTLGHHYFPDDAEYRRQFPFRERVPLDGSAGGGACPLDENLRSWVQETYSLYAELQPEYIFVDDDFRTMMKGGLSCFCTEHLRRIGELAGREVTREEVVDAVFFKPDSLLRKYYFDVTTDGFVSLAKLIRESVKAGSPDTRIGLMSACLPHGIAGMDLDRILAALAGDDQPLLRPQLPLYYELMMQRMPAQTFNPSLMRAALPKNVEHYAELECVPYGSYAKSASMTAAQAFALLMQGFSTQAFTFFDSLGHPFAEEELLISAFEKHNPFFNRVAELIPEGSPCLGVKTAVGRNTLRHRHIRRQAAYFNDRELAEALPNCGLPLGTPDDSPFVVLTGDDVRSMTHEEIDGLLKHGALLDFHALNALHDMGFGERIGIRCTGEIAHDELGIEEYSFGFGKDFDSSKCRQPIRYFCYADHADVRRLVSDERAEAWSMIRNFRLENVIPGLLVRENDAGERFGVFSITGDAEHKFLANYDRTRQLRRLFSHIARRPLPLAAHQNNAYLWLLLNKTADGRLLAGIINCSSDTTEEITLLAGPEFSNGFARITADGEEAIAPTSTEADPDGTGALICRLPVTLKPMDFILLGAL
ncbi:MAG: hypothetical protein J6S21_05880, partial [Victivallales bacterium]|nr:hypothetical protein [Victivallales bacterium]